jgi:hypothetical protein
MGKQNKNQGNNLAKGFWEKGGCREEHLLSRDF